MEETAPVILRPPLRRTQTRLQPCAEPLCDQESPADQSSLHRQANSAVMREWVIPALVRRFLAERSATAPVTPVGGKSNTVPAASISRPKNRTRKLVGTASRIPSSATVESGTQRLDGVHRTACRIPLAVERREAREPAALDDTQTRMKAQHSPRPELPGTGIRMQLRKSDGKSRLSEVLQRGSGSIPPNKPCQ